MNRLVDDVVKRADAHGIRVEVVDGPRPAGTWLRASGVFDRCPSCGAAGAIVEHDGLGPLFWCDTCRTPAAIAEALAAPLDVLPDADKLDVLLGVVFALVRELGREVVA